MNEHIQRLAEQAMQDKLTLEEFVQALRQKPHGFYGFRLDELTEFTRLVVLQCCEKAPKQATEMLDHFGFKP